jgi:phosphate transport system substrate-binding protein
MIGRTAWAATALACAVLAACSGESSKGKAGAGVFTIVVDGSSTVFPISEAAGEAFQQEQRGRLRVTVAESGTGGGFKKFCRGETHVQDASRPILASEMAACAEAGVRYIELPIAFDALSVVVHPSNPVQSITMAELKRIWSPEAQGKIDNWRKVNPSFPDLRLSLYGAGTASGTFDYFTEAVNGKAKASRTDYQPTEDDNVTAQGVAGEPGAMGYFGLAYYEQNVGRVRALAVSHDGKPPVAPSAATVEDGSYVPLSRPIFIYVSVGALDREPVAQFVEYYLNNADTLVRAARYVPLPSSAYATARGRVSTRTAGTAFGGENDVGADISEVLRRPLVETLANSQKK